MRPLLNFLSALDFYDQIAHEFLLRYLSDDQISSFFDLFNTPNITHRAIHKIITEEHGYSDNVFWILACRTRIKALIDAVQNPGETSIDPGKAIHNSLLALQSGLLIGMVVDDKKKEALLTVAEHGLKFAKSVGKHNDELTYHLVSLFNDFFKSHGRYPGNKEVVSVLETQEKKGFIHSISDEEIEWGKNEVRVTSLTTLPNRLTRVRAILGITHKKN